jgi:hypothetical protein
VRWGCWGQYKCIERTGKGRTEGNDTGVNARKIWTWISFSLCSLFWRKKKVDLWETCCLCVCVSPYRFSNAWTNLYEISYTCHGTWAHLNAVLHKSRPLVFVSVFLSPHLCYSTARQKHYSGNKYTRNNRSVGRFVFYAVRVLWKERRRFVLPGTCCLFNLRKYLIHEDSWIFLLPRCV